MDRFTTTDFGHLAREKAGPCISVYLPTYLNGERSQQNPIRLKNLLQQADDELTHGWLRPPDGRKLLQPARDLINNSLFWEGRDLGLAMFISPDGWTRFRLAREFEERVVVNRRFYVKPLIPLLNDSERFYILALSQNNTRLFQASRYSIRQVEIDAFPTSMQTTLNYTSVERGSQTHSAARGGQSGKQAAVFHGHGGIPDAHKDDLTRYFRSVDQVVRKNLADSARPLLLAGVHYLLPIYREVNAHPGIVSTEVHGNFDYEPTEGLLAKAWSVMEPFFKSEYEESCSRFRELTETGRACDDVERIVPAAYDGRVETLFLDELAHEWGVYASDSRFVEAHQKFQQGDDDLLDLAAVETLCNQGRVYAVNRNRMPADNSIAALMRY